MSNPKSSLLRSVVLTILMAAFVVSMAWGQTFKVLHAFGNTGDGLYPAAGQAFDSQGNLYGVTTNGPSGSQCFNLGCGTVYQLKPNGDGTWTETVIFAFNGNDGAFPSSGFLSGQQGALYGVTSAGGNSGCGGYGCGTVYELTPIAGLDHGTWKSRVHRIGASAIAPP